MRSHLKMLSCILAFVFMDASAKDDDDLPPELREKYIITSLLGR